jgi:hypothetical protein
MFFCYDRASEFYRSLKIVTIGTFGIFRACRDLRFSNLEFFLPSSSTCGNPTRRPQRPPHTRHRARSLVSSLRNPRDRDKRKAKLNSDYCGDTALHQGEGNLAKRTTVQKTDGPVSWRRVFTTVTLKPTIPSPDEFRISRAPVGSPAGAGLAPDPVPF